jgi:hypothetical protein
MQKMFIAQREQLQSFLGNLDSRIALCIGTSKEARCIAITAHWISDRWTREQAVLDIKFVHTIAAGDSLAEFLISTIESFALASSNIVAILSDSPADIPHLRQKLATLFPDPPTVLPCLNKVTHIAVARAVDALSLDSREPVKKLRTVIGFIASSQEIQQCFNQACQTHVELSVGKLGVWQSTLTMVKAALSVKNQLNTFAAGQAELQSSCLNEQDWEYLDQLLSTLELLNACISRLDNPYTFSLSAVASVVNTTLNVIPDFKPNDNLPEITMALNKLAETFIRCFPISSSAACILSSALDPRFGLRDLPAERRVEAENLLFSTWHEYTGPSASVDFKSPASSSEDMLWSLRYPNISMDANICEWWAQHGQSCPRLTAIARDYLAAPSSCTGHLDRLFIRVRKLFGRGCSGNEVRARVCLRSWI